MRDEHGFTVGRLLVIVSIVVVAVGVAVTVLISAQGRSADQEAKARAQTALVVQQERQRQNRAYAQADELEASEPSLDYTDQAVVAGKVFVRVEGDTVTLASRSDSGRCYWVRESDGITLYASADCDVPAEQLAFRASWRR